MCSAFAILDLLDCLVIEEYKDIPCALADECILCQSAPDLCFTVHAITTGNGD